MDQSRDISGRERYRLSELLDAPEFVKRASGDDLCGDEHTPPDAYAYPPRSLFACHTPAATWMSTAFFLDKKAHLDPRDVTFIDDRLQHYAKYHKITNAINELRTKFAASQEVSEESLDDDDYAMVVYDRGIRNRQYTLRNSLEVKAAAAYLHKHRDSFPFDIRLSWADKVLQKAAAYGTTLGEHNDYIERQSGNGHCTVKEAIDLIRGRVAATRQGGGPLTELQTGMVELADMLHNNPSTLYKPGMRVKLASVIDGFDRATGLNHQYGDIVRRPEDVLFELTTEKMAKVVNEHVSTTTGNIYHITDLEKLGAGDVRKYMGDEFVDEISSDGRIDIEKAAAIVPTLDRGLAVWFDELMQATGVNPVAKEAGDGYGFSHDYLLAMAAERRRQGR
jgi:hypothetical protein